MIRSRGGTGEPCTEGLSDTRSDFCAKLSGINREKLVDTLKDIWASLVAGVRDRV